MEIAGEGEDIGSQGGRGCCRVQEDSKVSIIPFLFFPLFVLCEWLLMLVQGTLGYSHPAAVGCLRLELARVVARIP